jgi:predicted transcriptional regulator
MTKTQASILESIAALPEAERRELIEHLVASNMGASSFYERMTPQQRAHLAEGIAQAERGDGKPAEEVYAELARRFDLPPA